MTSIASTDSPGRDDYAFGPFVADSVKRTLWREGCPVAITPKTFEVLLALLRNRHRLVTKDELLATVWSDAIVGENNLARQISSLRRALGERPEQHDYILTVPGAGYRFVAAVRQAPDPGAFDEPSSGDGARQAPIAPVESGPDADPVPPARRGAEHRVRTAGRRSWSTTAILVASACGLIGVTSLAVLRRSDRRDAAVPSRRPQETRRTSGW